jgi:hypothetical protein
MYQPVLHILPSQTGPLHAVSAVKHTPDGRYVLVLQVSG